MVVSMMQTLVVPILGLIRSNLGTTTAQVSWVTTATLLSAAVFTPLLGRFGDQHGRSRPCRRAGGDGRRLRPRRDHRLAASG